MMTDQNLEPVAATDTPPRLPELIDRARTRLSEARTSAEVLESRAMAQAAMHYAKVTKAANDTQADCLRLIVRAEMRMAREIDAAQERGEVAVRGRPGVNVQSSDIYYPELGVDRRRVSEWRDAAEAGDEIVDRAIDNAVKSGVPPRHLHVRMAVNKFLQRREIEPQEPGHVVRLQVWLRNGSMLCESFGSGEQAVADCRKYGVELDLADLEILQSFASGLLSEAKAVRAA
jgi:hypothetical protein